MKHLKKFIRSDNDETVYEKVIPYFVVISVALIIITVKMFGV